MFLFINYFISTNDFYIISFILLTSQLSDEMYVYMCIYVYINVFFSFAYKIVPKIFSYLKNTIKTIIVNLQYKPCTTLKEKLNNNNNNSSKMSDLQSILHQADQCNVRSDITGCHTILVNAYNGNERDAHLLWRLGRSYYEMS